MILKYITEFRYSKIMDFKECLSQRNISAYTLAKRTGLPYSCIADLRSNKTATRNLTLEKACKIASALGVEPKDLLECNTHFLSGAVAWYTAIAKAQSVENTTGSSIVVAGSTVEASANIWIKLIPEVTQQCGFTDPTGAAYAVVGGVLYAATNVHNYGIVSIGVKAYSASTCLPGDEISSGDNLLKGVAGTYKFDAVASARARITQTLPSSFETTFSGLFENTIDKAVTVTVTDAGAISVTAGDTLYYSVSGNSENTAVYADAAAFSSAASAAEKNTSQYIAAGYQYVGMTVDADTTLTPLITFSVDA